MKNPNIYQVKDDRTTCDFCEKATAWVIAGRKSGRKVRINYCESHYFHPETRKRPN